MPWWLVIVAAVALSVINYLLRPKPKAPKPDSVKDLEDPTAEAGRPKPVIFGKVTIKGLNYLWYGEKSYIEKEVDA